MFLDGLLAKHGKLHSEPGGRSSYSNLGTLVLGQVLSSVAGRPYVDLVQDLVLQPLGMAASGFSYTDPMAGASATGYHPRFSPMRALLPRWVSARRTAVGCRCGGSSSTGRRTADSWVP